MINLGFFPKNFCKSGPVYVQWQICQQRKTAITIRPFSWSIKATWYYTKGIFYTYKSRRDLCTAVSFVPVTYRPTYIVITKLLNLLTFISVQRPRSTRSSSVVTLARPPSSSSLKVTDRSFRYASPCLWNQLPLSLRQPHSRTNSSISDLPIPSPVTSSSFESALCSSITPSFSLPA